MTKRVSLSNGAKSVVGALLLAASFGMQAEAWAGPFDADASLNPTAENFFSVTASPSDDRCHDYCQKATLDGSLAKIAFLYRYGDFYTAYTLLFSLQGGDSVFQVGRVMNIEQIVSEDCTCAYRFKAGAYTVQPAPAAIRVTPQPLS
jgi:hypothetical protein